MNMKNRLTILSAIPPLIMMGTVAYDRYAAEPARHHDYWRVPTKQPVPQSLQEAGRLSSEIDRHEATWTAEMDELTKLIEGQKPGEFHLSDEIATADAFSAYVAHLLRAGESAVETFVRMEGTIRKVSEALKRAPAKFRETAALPATFCGRDPVARNQAELPGARRYLGGEGQGRRDPSK